MMPLTQQATKYTLSQACLQAGEYFSNSHSHHDIATVRACICMLQADKHYLTTNVLTDSVTVPTYTVHTCYSKYCIACCTDLQDFISGVRVSGTGRALSQQGQQASCDKTLAGWRLTRAGPGQAVCGQHGHSHCQNWDAGPVLGHQPRCGAPSGQDHYERGVYLHL